MISEQELAERLKYLATVSCNHPENCKYCGATQDALENLRQHLEKMEPEIRRLRTALSFYADVECWIRKNGNISPAYFDGGARAREAIK